MKVETMMPMVQSMVTASTEPLRILLEQTGRRAEAAEARNAELVNRILDSRTSAQAGSMPIIGELLKTVKPEVWQVLMGQAGAPEEGGGWLSIVRDLAQSLGPALSNFMLTAMKQQGVPVRASQPALAPPRSPTDPQPSATPRGEAGAGMPLELNAEQVMARDFLVDFIKAGDHLNAFAMLDSFPGFVPVQDGAVPMGEYLIGKIDPAVNPKIYLPQFAMLIPEIREMLPQAEAFIGYIMKRIVADGHAAAQASPSVLPPGSPARMVEEELRATRNEGP